MVQRQDSNKEHPGYGRRHILKERCFCCCQKDYISKEFLTHNVIPFETKLYGVGAAVVDGITIADRLLAVDILFVLVAVSIGQYSI